MNHSWSGGKSLQNVFLCGRHMDEMWYWSVSKTQISRDLGKNIGEWD
jgi:hypothetical protein